MNFSEDELNGFRDHPTAADVPTLVTALEHAYEVLRAHETVIDLYTTLHEKLNDYYQTYLNLIEAVRTNDKVVWEARKFLCVVRKLECQKGAKPET